MKRKRYSRHYKSMPSPAIDQDVICEDRPEFLLLPDEPFRCILSFLNFEELNKLELVSKRCHETRNLQVFDHEQEKYVSVFDPTRDAILTFRRPYSRNSDEHDGLREFSVEEMNAIFMRIPIHTVRLSLRGQEHFSVDLVDNRQDDAVSKYPPRPVPMPQIRVLKLQHTRVASTDLFYYLMSACYKLQELEMDSTTFPDFEKCRRELYPFITKICLTNMTCPRYSFDSACFAFAFNHNLKEMYLDHTEFERNENIVNPFLYYGDTQLEKVSCVGTKVAGKPVPQSELIEFVQSATQLQWFRSDLKQQHIAMLQEQRPGIIFVSPEQN